MLWKKNRKELNFYLKDSTIATCSTYSFKYLILRQLLTDFCKTNPKDVAMADYSGRKQQNETLRLVKHKSQIIIYNLKKAPESLKSKVEKTL